MGRRTDKGDPGVKREYFRFLIPTIVGMIAHSFYCLADVFFVGIGVGSDGLAAVNVALPMFTFYSTFSVLVGVGAATTIAICRGAGDTRRINKAFTLAMVLVAVMGLLVMTVGTTFLRPICRLLGATDQILPMVVDYLRPVNQAAVVYMMANALSVIVRSDGNPKLVMAAGTAGNLLNILLDYVFVIGMGMGTFGAGLATIIGPCVTTAILSLHFITRHNNVYFTRAFADGPLLGRLLRNGVGSSILELSSGLIILLFNVALLRVSGEEAVAVFSIISNIGYVGKGIFNGMAQAAQPIISQNYGAGNPRVVRQVNRYAMTTALVFACCVYGLVLLFPSQLIAFFISNDPALVTLGARAVVLYFLSFPFTGMNTVLMYYFQSIEKSLCTVLIAVLRGVVLISAALAVLAALFGVTGVWLALFAAEGVTFCIFYPVKVRMERKDRLAESL